MVCTDGAGSTQGDDPTRAVSSSELVARRVAEQREAASLGGYGFVSQLLHPSSVVRSPAGQQTLVEQLEALLRATRPANIYTHNLADKHDTHVAVAAAAVKAVRLLPEADRPVRMVGVEGWRDLDWLPDHDKVRMDVTPYADLANRLAQVFTSQLGPKRYDLASEGRRRANATIFEPRQPDDAEQVIVALDLTPLARNDDVDPVRYVRSAIERFGDEVARTLAPYW